MRAKMVCQIYRSSHAGTLLLGTSEFNQSVVKFRNKARHQNKQKLVFIDATGIKQNARPLRGLAPTGKRARVQRERAEAFSARIDMLAAVGYDGPLAATTITPEQREKPKQRGVTKARLLRFLTEDVAPAIAARAQWSHVIITDQGLHPRPDEIKAALASGGANNVEEPWLIPTGAGKFVNPLDNTLFSTVKTDYRGRRPGTLNQAARNLRDAFMQLSQEDVRACYKHCGLTRAHDSAYDLDG